MHILRSVVLAPLNICDLSCIAVSRRESEQSSVHTTRVHGSCLRAVNTGVQNDCRLVDAGVIIDGHP